MSGSLPTGCPIRTSVGLRVFAPRHGFSQLVTSFVASESLGIPHAPLFRSVISSWLFGINSLLAFDDHDNCLMSAFTDVSHGRDTRRSFALLFLFLVSSLHAPPRHLVSNTQCLILTVHYLAKRSRFHHVIVLFQVENNGVEPLTLCVQSRCSSQLS